MSVIAASSAPDRRASLPIVQANDNRAPAGQLKNGELQLHLVMRMARWYPESPMDPYVDLPVFAEEGGAPQIPAPLIRVRTGATIVATIRNELADSTIYVHGLATRPASKTDSIPIPPGQSRTIRFLAGAPGTYTYAGYPGILNPDTGGERDEAGGALVIDPEGVIPADRIFVLNIWGNLFDSTSYSNALAINGKSWPYTERISATVGDSLRWRVVNATSRNHPMHLHGFYFRVDAHGDGNKDSLYTLAQQRLGVTEDLSPGHTVNMVWSPDREGNWLFHCHLSFHVVPGDAQLHRTNDPHATHSGSAEHHMSGLVLGINVRRGNDVATAARTNARQLHLFIDEGRRRGVSPRALGYVLQTDNRIPAADSVELPGSVIVLTKNEPTDITVVNRLRESSAVHWHGIELESYSDGVAGWSGSMDHLAPMIAAGDSFTARLTLPRTGTFIYHTHLNDIEQLTSGLYGAIVVLEPGRRFDPKTDHLFIAGWDGASASSVTLINGDTASAPLEIVAGVPQRFRFINIGPANRLVFAIRRDSSVVTWRRLAKDGADLPPAMAVAGPAAGRLAVGEMFDAEFIAPTRGEYTLTVGSPKKQMRYRRRIIVR